MNILIAIEYFTAEGALLLAIHLLNEGLVHRVQLLLHLLLPFVIVQKLALQLCRVLFIENGLIERVEIGAVVLDPFPVFLEVLRIDALVSNHVDGILLLNEIPTNQK